jgi:hypothetical protein
MKIKNSTSEKVSWFCFNHLDTFKWIALNSGNLNEEDTEKSYTPPDNIDGFYSVRFTHEGGGTELASGTVSKTGSINLIKGKEGTYEVDVTT